jgi:hypothetical protein
MATSNPCNGLIGHGSLLIDDSPYNTKLVSDVTANDTNLFYLIEPWPEYNTTGRPSLSVNSNMPINWGSIIRDIGARIVELAQTKQLTIVLHIPEYTAQIPEVNRRVEMEREARNIPASQFKFVSGMATPEFYFWPSFEYSQRLTYDRAPIVTELNLKKRDKKFTCLTRIDKGHRRYTSYKIWDEGLNLEGYFSYAFLCYSGNKLTRCTAASWAPYWGDEWGISGAEWAEFYSGMPYKADGMGPIGYNDHWHVQTEHYNNAYWNFVLETAIDEVPFLTEKTYKPIGNLQPFVINGCYHSLQQLKELGYQTFNGYIDESYDNIKIGPDRVKAATEVMLGLASMTHDEHITLMHKIAPILHHNQTHFFNSKHRLKYFVKYLTGGNKMHNWLRDCNYD